MRRALWLSIGRLAARSPRGLPASATPHDEAMMGRALALAKEAAALGEVPVGAVVYHTASGEVVGEGSNRREADASPSAHAEFLAMERACRARGDWRLSDCTLVVTLEPCAMCAGLIVNARVGRLVYGAADPKAGAAGSLYRLTEDRRLNHRVTPIAGVRTAECAAVLRAFFVQRRAAKARGSRRGSSE